MLDMRDAAVSRSGGEPAHNAVESCYRGALASGPRDGRASLV